MNRQHPSISFTMELQIDGKLPFLDILPQRKSNGTLGHGVYRKPTHTGRYLNGNSNHHHPTQRRAVLNTLFQRARVIADKNCLPEEIDHLKTTFLQNRYSGREISLTLKRSFDPQARTMKEEKEKPIARAYLPYVASISRIVARHKIEVIHKPPGKIRNVLVRAMDPICLKTPGIYQGPCTCGDLHIGETGRTIETRLKEHKRHLRLGQLKKSAIGVDHSIDFNGTNLISRAGGYRDRVIKESIEIRMAGRDFNRDSGYSLSNTRKPV
ncbi:uncharacterized protein [Hetaerina americana]|uniref:uncharacterized protein n=1 Tax=Hetaerina americana TaxID=62018 RepID=UPI003A7F2FC1